MNCIHGKRSRSYQPDTVDTLTSSLINLHAQPYKQMDTEMLSSLATGTVVTGEPVLEPGHLEQGFIAREERIPGQLYTNGSLVSGALTHHHKDDPTLCIFTTVDGDIIPTHESSIRPSLPRSQ